MKKNLEKEKQTESKPSIKKNAEKLALALKKNLNRRKAVKASGND